MQFLLSTLTHLAATSSTRLTLNIVHQDNIDYQNNDNIDFWSILIIIRKAFGVWQLLFPQESFSDGSEVLILNAPQSKVWPHSSSKIGTGGQNGPKSHIKQVLNLKISLLDQGLIKTRHDTFSWFLSSNFISPVTFQVHLQFWSGVPTKPGWEAYDLEIYINNVHDEHMIGPFCGFDQWIDNHIAIDAGPGAVSF